MTQPLVSVIVPVYNCEKYVKECVNSIIEQSYPNIEVLLVDDGSSDSSYQICMDFQEKYSRIKVLHKENGGASSARNMALSQAKGEYIAFVDSDDIIDKNYIRKLYDLMVSEGADISSCGYDTTLPDGKIVPCESFGLEKIGPNIGDIDLVHYPYTVWHLLFRRESIGNIRFDESIYFLEDLKFVDEVFMKSALLVGNSEPLYHRIAHKESLTETRYCVENFPRFFTLIHALEDMCDITRSCDKLHKQRVISLIKEGTIMRAFMSYKKIEDPPKKMYLKKIILQYYQELKKQHLLKREKLILWLCMASPALYCKMKHISFSENNSTIS